MLSRIEVFFRKLRRFFSRTHWAIRLLRLPILDHATQEPGLVIAQIDGLSLTQITKALQAGRMPFLSSLLSKERYILHTFYSGLPSNTPSVQAELFYGIKGCVPAFNFIDRKLGRAVKMFDASYVEQFEPRLKEKAGQGLLTGGSSYSNIYTGGAKEAHFCWAQLGLGGVWHAVNPFVFPFLVILYIDIFLRTFVLLVVEFFLALVECIRGTLKGRIFLRELELVWLRTLICIFLREVIVAGACMDIVRGLPVIHLNFLGYDEQAHGRGPSSSFAHWSLRGIDDGIRRLNKTIRQCRYREYDLWVYGDHGQEKTTPYLVKYGKTVEDAIEQLFGMPVTPSVHSSHSSHESSSSADLFRKRNKKEAEKYPEQATIDFGEKEVIVTAMGPLGHVYIKKILDKAETEAYVAKLVSEIKLPLVMLRQGDRKVAAYTPKGIFILPEQSAEVFGADHPFLEEIKEDLIRMCYHEDAGEIIIGGWSLGEEPISFPLEFGAHTGMTVEETRSFALLPMDTPLKPTSKTYLRPTNLREAAQSVFNKETLGVFTSGEKATAKPLRIMSYNTHGCLGMDGVISAERVARVIARNAPDVVALQEMDVGRQRSKGMDQVARIAKYLGMKYHFHPANRWEEEQYGNAILSRYPLALIKMDALSQLSSTRKTEPRGAMWVTVEFQGRPIHIINTHLSIWPRERILQVKDLMSPNWLQHPDFYGPAVLCGDFNSLPGSVVYQRVCQKMQDTQAILEGHKACRTFFGQHPLGQIDYIFVTPEFQVKAIAVPRTSLDKVASDHLPLIADLTLATPQASLDPAAQPKT